MLIKKNKIPGIACRVAASSNKLLKPTPYRNAAAGLAGLAKAGFRPRHF